MGIGSVLSSLVASSSWILIIVDGGNNWFKTNSPKQNIGFRNNNRLLLHLNHQYT